MTNILRDDQLGSASEIELRAHYEEAAQQHFDELGLSDEQKPTLEETARAFARFAGCDPADVVVIPSPEAGGTSHLFKKLTSEELREVSSWTLGTLQ